MLSGDHVLPRITPNISVPPAGRPRPPRAISLPRLDKVAAYDVDEVLPAHEHRFVGPAGPGGRAEGPSPGPFRRGDLGHPGRRDDHVGMASRMTWSRPWDQIQGFMRRAAVGETLAHLHYLERLGVLPGGGRRAVRVAARRHRHPGLMNRTLVDADGTVLEGVAREDVQRRLADPGFFWLDLPGLGDEELAWMRDLFHFHPLAIDDAEHFSERPKLEEYDGFVFLVMYGSATAVGEGQQACTPEDLQRLSEVHCFVSDHYLVTVHRADCPAFGELVTRMQLHKKIGGNPSQLFYRVADTLVDSFFPTWSELDDRIDALQSAGDPAPHPNDSQLGAACCQSQGAP